jgi:hypothetical protein
MKANSKISSFINDALFIDEQKGEILITLRKLILKTFPKTGEEIKYGGLVFIIDKRLFCGIFLRKNHMSVEFDYGAEMSDPDKLLEGSGKYRRHLKINNLDDIMNKKVEFYLKQSFKN